MSADVAQMRRHFQQHPAAMVDLPAWELLELLDELGEARRRAAALQEHLAHRHGCMGVCRGSGGE